MAFLRQIRGSTNKIAKGTRIGQTTWENIE